MNQGFAARVGRIESGHTWRPDGVLHAQMNRRGRRRLPLTQRPNFRFGLLTVFAAVVTSMLVDPAMLPEPLRAMMTAEGIAAYADMTGLAGLLEMIPGF